MKRLSVPTGAVISNDNHSSDSEGQIVRPAILVHAGPEGEPIEFQSGDGPMKFDSNRIQNIVKIHNSKLADLAAGYGGEDKIPMGAYPPILDQHADDSNDRIIGRLTGKLRFEVRDVPKVGKNVPCAISEGITFLGKETTDRVKDGRIYHLSIGINEEDDTLGETSTVIQPAAPGAMLLRKGEKNKVDQNGGSKKMSDKLSKLKAAHEDRMKKLTALKDGLGASNKKLEATHANVKLQAKKSDITHRLGLLMRSGKMTPAEYKNLVKDDGLVKMSKIGDEALGIALSVFEAREKSVINPTQIGSSAALDFSEVGANLEKNQFKRLKAEIAKDFKKMTGKKMLAEEDETDPKSKLSGPKEFPVEPGKDPHEVPGQAGDEEQLKHMWHMMKKHLEAGNIDGVKEEHSKMGKHMSGEMKHMSEYAGDVKSEDEKNGMNDLQHQVDELNTQLARMAGMVDELIGVEKEEGEHLGEMGKEHEQVSA